MGARIAFTAEGLGSVSRDLSDKIGDVVSVKDFGAGSGLADDTDAIQKTVDAVQGSGGGVVSIPPGRYTIDGTITLNDGPIHIVGAGAIATDIRAANGALDVFRFSGASEDSSISGLRIKSDAVASAGSAILCSDGVGAVQVRNCRIEGTYRGISTSNPPVTGVVQVVDCNISKTVSDGIYVNGASQIFVSGSTIYRNNGALSGAGIHIVSCGGSWIQNTTGTGYAQGLLINPTSGSNVFDTFLSNFEADSSIGAGILLDASGGGRIIEVMMANVRAGFGSAKGFAFGGANLNGVFATNCVSEKNLNDGFFIAGGNRISLMNCAARGNSAMAPGSYHGFNIAGGDDISVRGGMSGEYPGSGSQQAYGCAIQNTFSGNLSIDGLDVRSGNAIGGLINSSASHGVRILNCPGHNPVGVQYPALPPSGVGYIAGASPELIVLTGGSVSQIVVGGKNIFITSGSFMLAPGQEMIVTYSAPPNFIKCVQ